MGNFELWNRQNVGQNPIQSYRYSVVFKEYFKQLSFAKKANNFSVFENGDFCPASTAFSDLTRT